MIDSAKDLPSSACYRNRFGSLVNAYKVAGYVPDRDYSYVEANKAVQKVRPQIIDDLRGKLAAVGATVSQVDSTDLFLINSEYSASVVMSRYRTTPAGSPRWLVRMDPAAAPDITILVRMDATNKSPTDYYLLPVIDVESSKFLLCETNGAHLDTFQFDSLDYLAKLSGRETIKEAA